MVFHEPNFEILGAPIGDAILCAKFLAQKWAKAAKFLSQMSEVCSLGPEIALLLLYHYATFCKLVHLAHSTPPALVSEGLALFDVEFHRHFCDIDCVATDSEWLQVQLSLSRGGLGLRRFALHCSTASVNKAGCSAPPNEFTLHAVTLFNSLVPSASSLTITSPLCSAILSGPCHRLVRQLSQQRPASSTPMDPKAKSWAGPASHWQWRPPPGWHPSWLLAEIYGRLNIVLVRSNNIAGQRAPTLLTALSIVFNVLLCIIEYNFYRN